MSLEIESLDAVDDPGPLSDILTEYLDQAVRDIAALPGAPVSNPDKIVADQVRYTMDDLGSYLPPAGSIFVAHGPGDELSGVVFQRMIRPDVAEIKRLYVREAARGRGLGVALTERVIEASRARGAKRLFLDTVVTMEAAIALYRRMGFVDIERFPEAQNPPEVWPHAVYLSLTL